MLITVVRCCTRKQSETLYRITRDVKSNNCVAFWTTKPPGPSELINAGEFLGWVLERATATCLDQD